MKLAIIDKGGTLTETVSGATFVQSPTDQKLIAGVEQAIAKLISEGYTLAIASNQGEVAAGHKSLQDAIAEMRYAMQLTGIDQAYFCPDMEGFECYSLDKYRDIPITTSLNGGNYEHLIGKYRKPDSGMLELAISRLYNSQRIWERQPIEETIFIGDRPEDEQAAHNAQIPFIHAKDWWIN